MPLLPKFGTVVVPSPDLTRGPVGGGCIRTLGQVELRDALPDGGSETAVETESAGWTDRSVAVAAPRVSDTK